MPENAAEKLAFAANPTPSTFHRWLAARAPFASPDTARLLPMTSSVIDLALSYGCGFHRKSRKFR
jgi:hypothetical protein